MNKKLSLAKLGTAFIAVFALFLTACETEEVIGSVIIGAGVVAVCSSSNVDCAVGTHHHRRHHRTIINNRRVRNDRVRRRGNTRRNNTRRNNNTRRGNRGHSLDATLVMETPALVEVGSEANLEPTEFAETFDLRVDSSEILITILEETRAGGKMGLLSLGLSEKDIKKISKLKMPSDKGVTNVAKTLGESPEAIEAMMDELVTIAKEELL